MPDTDFMSPGYLSYESGEGGEKDGEELGKCAVRDHQVSDCFLDKKQVLVKYGLQCSKPCLN